jgi:hypothetical protein
MVLLALFACNIENGFDGAGAHPEEPVGELLVDPDLIDFGLLEMDDTGAASFTIESVGTGPVDLFGLTLTGSQSFELAWDTTVTQLYPGDTLVVDVTYTPHNYSEMGWVAVTSDAETDTLEVVLAGGGIIPALEIDPSAVELRSYLGEEVAETVILRSVGTATLELNDMVPIAGDDWSFVAPTFPLTLEPGEETELEVIWNPGDLTESSGEVWFATNTPSGQAMLPLSGINDPPCMGLAEAWEVGSLEARTTSAGQMVLTNIDEELDICIDRWTVWISEYTQDMSLGDMFTDSGQRYPYGTITLEPGDERSFTYNAQGNAADAWWCVEELQLTQPTSNWLFFGARTPDMLLTHMLDGDQDAVWAAEQTQPVFVVGRDTNVVQVGDEVTLHAMNLGRRDAFGTISETLPPGYDARNFSVEPDQIDESEDGITFTWTISLDAAVDTGEYNHTLYDHAYIHYELLGDGAECEKRSYLNEPAADWTDLDGINRTAVGSPLLVVCED